jgi:purine nucleosidase
MTTPTQTPIKILLDTDIGSDIDDAVCLAYLLAQPRCQLLGITTVTGQAVQRARMASALCRVAGKQVPIFPGAENPLLVPQLQPLAPQAAALERWPHSSDFPAGQALSFLSQTIRSHPGQVILLTIGPLTNIGLLFALDPGCAGLLKGLVMMCGAFVQLPSPGNLKVPAEWNARLDPHATAIVYRTPVAIHRSIGLNVTLQTVLPADEVRARFQAPLLQPVKDFAEIWFKEARNLTFHDPLAAATIFDQQVCTFSPGQVVVDLALEPGRTDWFPAPGSAPHEVAAAVDPAQFFEHFFAVFA